MKQTKIDTLLKAQTWKMTPYLGIENLKNYTLSHSTNLDIKN